MSAILVKTRIPESRQITLTLPPDVPVGDAELEIIVRDPATEFTITLPQDDRPREFPKRPTHPALAAEFDAFEKKLPELLKQFAGKYVAMRGGEVVAVADTEVGALTAAREKQPGEMAYVRLVTDHPQPVQRIPSFRQLPRE